MLEELIEVRPWDPTETLWVQNLDPDLYGFFLVKSLILHKAFHFDELFLVNHSVNRACINPKCLNKVCLHLIIHNREHLAVLLERVVRHPRLRFTAIPFLYEKLCLLLKVLEFDLGGLCVSELEFLHHLFYVLAA